jgi:hypothetical protein
MRRDRRSSSLRSFRWPPERKAFEELSRLRLIFATLPSRLRTTSWNVAGVLGANYYYDKFNENSHRVTYAQNLYDATLDRSYDYDQVGRLQYTHSGKEARWHAGVEAYTPGADGPYSHHYGYDQWGNVTYRLGWGGWAGGGINTTLSYSNNRLQVNPYTGQPMGYDSAGNLTSDGQQAYQYDATGQQTWASGTSLSQGYDGDGLREVKTESGASVYYLRSSVLGGQVVAEIDSAGVWRRGYVYSGSQLLAV